MFKQWLDSIIGRTPPPARFAQMMEAALRENGYTGTITFEVEQFRLKQGDGVYFFLANAYSDYRAARRSDRATVIARYARGLAAQSALDEPSLDAVRAKLMPVIRNLASILDVHREQMGGVREGSALLFRSYGPDCVELLATDQAEVTKVLTRGPSKEWEINLDEALHIAHANLRAATTDAWTECAPGVYRGQWGDGYDSSRALMPDVLERAPVKGRPVFMIPTRDVLLVTGDRDQAGLLSMLDLAHEAFGNGGRWISAHIFCHDDARRPIPFAPDSSETRERQRDLERLLLNDSYAAQQITLASENRREGRDVFVATYVLRRKQGSQNLSSFCTWTQDVPSLLPLADVLFLALPGDKATNWSHIEVEWRVAMSMIGHLLEEVAGCYPPRYQTLGFPDENLRKQLAERAGQV